MGLIKEFKEFAMKGNVVDLAVGVIIGAAFGKIVNSMVEDILMPPLGLLMNKVDFKNLYLPLTSKVPMGLSLDDARKLGPVLAYGPFINSVINFVIVAACIFAVIKAMNAARLAPKPAPAALPAPTKTETLLTEIRDLLRAR
jgi:large conductance mechanosensitive channel